MAINKVTDQNGNVLLDLTNDTVAKNTLYYGATAHGKCGNVITGEVVPMEHHDIPDGIAYLHLLRDIGFYSIADANSFGDIPDGFTQPGTLEVLLHEGTGHQVLRDYSGGTWTRTIIGTIVTPWSTSGSSGSLIDTISLNGTTLPIVNRNVDIPVASRVLGVVRSSTRENTIFVGGDGEMSVNTLNVNRLVQTPGELLNLDCGDSD